MVTIFVLLVLIVGVGVGVLAVRNRTEHGIESGISSFRREMRALAPRPGDRDLARSPHDPVADDYPLAHFEQDPGVHLLNDRPDDVDPSNRGPDAAGDASDDPFGGGEPGDHGRGGDGFDDDGFGDD